MAPVIAALRAENVPIVVCATGQHREMLDQVLKCFDLQPDHDLDLMRAGQTPAEFSARLLSAMDSLLVSIMPRRVLVQGDTLTAHITALAAFYRRIPVGHIEAGLRTYNLRAPWPEEGNRRMLAAITDLHFAPTDAARANLIAERVPKDHVFVTGNTVIDALFATSDRLRADPILRMDLRHRFGFLEPARRLILVTGHRRESFGPAFESLCRGLRRIALEHDDVDLVYAVHLNPGVREPVWRILGGGVPSTQSHIHLIEPVDYLAFVYLLEKSSFVITDSGGVQEEAPSLGKPVLVMRDTTERPEVVRAGAAELVGTQEDAIASAATRLLTDATLYRCMSMVRNLYGDGRAGRRIASILRGEPYEEWQQ